MGRAHDLGAALPALAYVLLPGFQWVASVWVMAMLTSRSTLSTEAGLPKRRLGAAGGDFH